jgi:hypothetical protein
MCMGRIDIILPDNKEKELRMEVGRRVGVRRGALTNAIIDAIDMWLKEGKEKRK